MTDDGGFALRPLHHVQLAVPRGSEPQCRRFWGEVLGMQELAKPPALAGRGGCWFRGGGLEVHLGVEEPFAPARKAHPGLLVRGLRPLAARLEAAGHVVTWDGGFPGYDRFYATDPAGNRLEFLEESARAESARGGQPRQATERTSERTPDLWRHLDDLRTGSHGGRGALPEQVALFADEVDRLDPYVRQALREVSDDWLDGTGEISRSDTVDDPEGHHVTRWVLSWPDQRTVGVEPVQLAARFAGQVHPHLGATRARDWPCHVYDDTDAARQLPLLRLLAESELHQRVFDADWRVVTRYRREHGPAD